MSVPRIFVPADVPPSMQATYIENMQAITQDTNNIFIFSCDQKIEHLNDDFFGEHISPEALYSDHLFTIASQGSIGAMAVPLGLLARYGTLFPNINYIVKLSGKTNVMPIIIQDAYSIPLWSVDDVLECKKNTNIPIRGVGMTIYIGSEYENDMIAHATRMIHDAHSHGLVSILWMYVRGKEVNEEKIEGLCAGICGLAHALGADIVKIKPPQNTNTADQTLRIATAAAGNTMVVCAGGEPYDTHVFLENLASQLHDGKTRGCAIGRTIFQKPLPEALAITHAISAIVYHEETAQSAWNIYQQKVTEYFKQMHT